jgi:protein-tyrosine-phosphatase
VFPHRNILIVCHANTSRSVIAEALLRRMLDSRLPAGTVIVRSAGVAPYARDGALASMDALLVLRDRGIELPRETKSTDLRRNRHLLHEADLVVAMTSEQIQMLHAGFPEAASKVTVTLRELAGDPGDIADPAGKEHDVFEACRDEIERCLERAVERWFAHASRETPDGSFAALP